MADPTLTAVDTRCNSIHIAHNDAGGLDKVTVAVKYDVVRNGNTDATITLTHDVLDDLSEAQKTTLDNITTVVQDIILTSY